MIASWTLEENVLMTFFNGNQTTQELDLGPIDEILQKRDQKLGFGGVSIMYVCCPYPGAQGAKASTQGTTWAKAMLKKPLGAQGAMGWRKACALKLAIGGTLGEFYGMF